MSTQLPTSKYLHLIEEAVEAANAKLPLAHRDAGLEWELVGKSAVGGSKIYLMGPKSDAPVPESVGHYDVLDYEGEHVILVWNDSTGPRIDRMSMFLATVEGFLAALDHAGSELPELD